jgi:predicted DNA repair protein MutK
MKTIGRGLMLAAPMLMKTLTVVGTVAMFLVGGGILAHGMPPVHHGIEQVAELSGVMGSMVSMALNALMGMICGTIALLGMLAFSAIRKMMAGVKA